MATTIVGTNTLLNMAKNLYIAGEITEKKLREMEERNKAIPEDWQKDTIILD